MLLKAKLIWSICCLSGCGEGHKTIVLARRKVKQADKNFRLHHGVVIKQSGIYYSVPQDGIHLSTVGMDIYLANMVAGL